MKLITDINLSLTLLSGQCFRVYKDNDIYTVILEDRVIEIKEGNGYIEVNSNNEENLEKIVSSYLDLNRDYNYINKIINLNNNDLKDILSYSKNYKILKQNKFEMLISYIISQNNRVSKISLSVDEISKLYGEKVVFNDKTYYLFPKYKKLKNITKEELRKCKVGFRDNYILSAIEYLNDNPNFLEEIDLLDTESALSKLMEIKGIGLKVASCILLFGYGRFDTFPIDTWVKKYFKEDNVKEIKKMADKKYADYKGLVLQYIFNYERNRNIL